LAKAAEGDVELFGVQDQFFLHASAKIQEKVHSQQPVINGER